MNKIITIILNGSIQKYVKLVFFIEMIITINFKFFEYDIIQIIIINFKLLC